MGRRAFKLLAKKKKKKKLLARGSSQPPAPGLFAASPHRTTPTRLAPRIPHCVGCPLHPRSPAFTAGSAWRHGARSRCPVATCEVSDRGRRMGRAAAEERGEGGEILRIPTPEAQKSPGEQVTGSSPQTCQRAPPLFTWPALARGPLRAPLGAGPWVPPVHPHREDPAPKPPARGRAAGPQQVLISSQRGGPLCGNLSPGKDLSLLQSEHMFIEQ